MRASGARMLVTEVNARRRAAACEPHSGPGGWPMSGSRGSAAAASRPSAMAVVTKANERLSVVQRTGGCESTSRTRARLADGRGAGPCSGSGGAESTNGEAVSAKPRSA